MNHSRKTPPIPLQEQSKIPKPDFRELLNRAGHSYRISRFGRFMTNPFISLALLLICAGMLFQLALKERTIESLQDTVYYAQVDQSLNWESEDLFMLDEDGDGEFEFDDEFPIDQQEQALFDNEQARRQIRDLEKRVEDLEQLNPSENARHDSHPDHPKTDDSAILPDGPAVGL